MLPWRRRRAPESATPRRWARCGAASRARCSRLEALAAEPERLDGRDARRALRRLQYALHTRERARASGSSPPRAPSRAHTELADALAGARDATARGRRGGRRPAARRRRAARLRVARRLFRVRLARLRLAGSPARRQAPPTARRSRGAARVGRRPGALACAVVGAGRLVVGRRVGARRSSPAPRPSVVRAVIRSTP